jgi:hypothetical protein
MGRERRRHWLGISQRTWRRCSISCCRYSMTESIVAPDWSETASEPRRRAMVLPALIWFAAIACGDTSDDRSVAEAGADVSGDAVTDCAQVSLPASAGTACGKPGLVCDFGSLSCSRKLTCESDGRWHLDCGFKFPDGGPCC